VLLVQGRYACGIFIIPSKHGLFFPLNDSWTSCIIAAEGALNKFYLEFSGRGLEEFDIVEGIC
jgi:hypothetical protein